MADALFTAPVDDLTPEGCEKLAQELGLPLEGFRKCVTDPATDQRIQADRTAFEAAGGYALPTIWVNSQQLVGSQSREVIEHSVEAALVRPSGS
jgi:predicted DsbA family dithiol-disulfide isomerase